MPDLTAETWTHIRDAYEHSDRPVADICAEHGISPGTLRDRVRRWRWTRRRPPISHEGPPAVIANEAPSPWPLDPRWSLCPGQPTAEPGYGDERGELPQHTEAPSFAALTPTPALPLAEGGGAGAEPADYDPATLVPRLQGAVARVLPAIEATIAKLTAGPQRPREMEQTARALGTLMRTLRELNALLAQQPRAADAYDDDMPEDIDAFRERLAQKIETFMESRGDEEFEEFEEEDPPEAAPADAASPDSRGARPSRRGRAAQSRA